MTVDVGAVINNLNIQGVLKGDIDELQNAFDLVNKLLDEHLIKCPDQHNLKDIGLIH